MLFIYELKKQLEKPFFSVVLVACVLFNLLVVCGNTYRLQQIRFQEKTAEALGTPFVTASAAEALPDEQQRVFAAGYVGGGIDPSSAKDILSAAISRNGFKLAGESKELAIEISAPTLEARLNGINENSEFCAINGGEELFRALFTELLLYCAAEGVVFALLITAKTASHEFSEKTAHTVYCTKKGRSLAAVKLLASAALSLAFFLLLCLFCYLIFFIVCPCPMLLGAPMNAMTYGLIVIPWFGASVIGFLLLNIALTAVLVVLFSLFQYVVSCRMRNPIVAVMISCAFWIGMFAPSFYIPAEGHWRLLWYSAPPVLLLDTPGYWLACSNRSLAIPGYEEIAMLAWGAAALLLCLLGIRRFKRRSIN